MNVYHLGALFIAAALVLACGMSNTCSHEAMPQVIQVAGVIVGGVFGTVVGKQNGNGGSQ